MGKILPPKFSSSPLKNDGWILDNDPCLLVKVNFHGAMLVLARWWWFQIGFYVHPDPWGFMIQFDSRIFLKRVGSTTN